MATKPHDHQIIHSSTEANWRTPPALFDRLHAEFHFGADAAANETSSLCGGIFFGPGSTIAVDALTCWWTEAVASYYRRPRTFFLNPPYSRPQAAAWRRAHRREPSHHCPFDVASWARKCWEESQRGATIVGLFPFAPQTDWYRQYVYGHEVPKGAPLGRPFQWNGHAALQERRLPHRVSFLRPDGTPADNAGVNSVVIVWGPATGIVGPWCPWQVYWSYR